MEAAARAISFTKQELLDVAGGKLAQLIYEGMSEPGAEATNGTQRRRKGKVSTTRARDVTEQQILDLLRAKGPLRLVEIMETTGLSQSSANKKIGSLKAVNAVKEVREGRIIRYAASRGGVNGARMKARSKVEKAEKAPRGQKKRVTKTDTKKASTATADAGS